MAEEDIGHRKHNKIKPKTKYGEREESGGEAAGTQPEKSSRLRWLAMMSLV